MFLRMRPTSTRATTHCTRGWPCPWRFAKLTNNMYACLGGSPSPQQTHSCMSWRFAKPTSIMYGTTSATALVRSFPPLGRCACPWLCPRRGCELREPMPLRRALDGAVADDRLGAAATLLHVVAPSSPLLDVMMARPAG